jgi:hypothetical protein
VLAGNGGGLVFGPLAQVFDNPASLDPASLDPVAGGRR